MKTKVILLAVLSSLFLCGCITEFEATGIGIVADILVVEGNIVDDESAIVLSRSVSIMDNKDIGYTYVDNAVVCVECDDGTQFHADEDSNAENPRSRSGRYIIETGKLNPERQYRLKIELEGNEYCSEFLHPMDTPEMDSVFWTKKGKGEPVNIYVATHAPDGMAQYYLWSYREDWEARAKIIMADTLNPYVCSKSSKSRELLLGTTERNALGRLTELIVEIPPDNDRLTHLYRIDVSQNAISKRAYDYYSNIKKNSQQTGGIMAHIPSELKGNITCTTDSELIVVGYVDVSSTTRKRMYIYCEGLIEGYYSDSECIIIPARDLERRYNYNIPPEYQFIFQYSSYALRRCINCAIEGGRSIFELEDWPFQYAKEGWYIRYFENLK